MEKEMNLKFIGIDSWGNEVFQDVNTKYFYMKEPWPRIASFYSTSEFDGEPGFPVKDDIKINIIKDDKWLRCETCGVEGTARVIEMHSCEDD